MQHEEADYDPEQWFARVLWIGGSPCAGKTSIAGALAAKYSLHVYHYDRHEPDHIARCADSSNFPALSAFLAMSMDERWVLRSPAAMADNVVASWTERFPLVVEDLLVLDMCKAKAIVAEGPGLFPELVHPLISNPHQAIWLVPTEEVIRTVRTSRPSAVWRKTGDPDRALENLIRRDILLAAYVKRQATELGLSVLNVDWSVPLEQMTATVESHFSPLPAAPATNHTEE